MKGFFGRFYGESVRKRLFMMNIIKMIKTKKRNVGISFLCLSLIVVILILGNNYIKANTNDIYHVYLANQKLGTVSDPEIVKQWLNKKVKELEKKNPGMNMVTNSDEITYTLETAFKGEYNNAAALKALEQNMKSHAVGYELKIDGKVMGIVKNKKIAKDILNQIKEPYTSIPKKGQVHVLSASHEEKNRINEKSEVVSADFVEKVELLPVKTNPGQMTDRAEIMKRIKTGGVKPKIYTVKKGDCISCIAEKFNVPQEVIYQKNPWIQSDLINIGDQLDLTVLQPELSVETVIRTKETVEAPYNVIYQEDATMLEGKSQVIVEGEPGIKQITYRITTINGEIVNEEAVSGEFLKEPVDQVVKQGTKIIPGIGSGIFNWPVKGAQITSEFGMRWGKFHEGTDNISSDRNIYASDHGKVVFAGRNGGYGKCVIIDHQNGYRTLYAHMSKINVEKGDKVVRGDIIGVMGTTGDSTGVHLHFEIEKDGKKQNPLKYLNE